MYASRIPTCRLIDYSASLKFDGVVALRKLIVDFVKGVRKGRQHGVSEKQILAWFRGTPDEFVRQRILEAVANGEIRIAAKSLSSARRSNGQYVYEHL